jgi:transcription initiation factor TFIID subunit 2
VVDSCEQAVHALMRQPTAIISSVLVKTALVPKYFYRIRCEAVLALASVSISCTVFPEHILT